MDIKSIAAKAAATVLSFSAAAVVAAVPAEATPNAPLPEFWGPGRYSASWVDLNQLCSRIGAGWAYQIVPGQPDTWRCQRGDLVPLAMVDRNLDNIVATQYRWGGFSTDPRTAFVHINAGRDCFGDYNGSFFQPYGW